MSYLKRGPLALAHRGGAALPANVGKENTLEAFSNAVALGYDYLETDVRASKDGVVYVFHDADFARLAGQDVQISDLDSTEIDQLGLADGAKIPRLVELLSDFSDTHLNVDIKSDDAVAPTLRLLREQKAADRVLIAAFSHRRLQRVRKFMPQVATSASPLEVAAWAGGTGGIRALARKNGAVAFQVPMKWGRLRIVTPANVRRARDLGMQVHVWTIDDALQMRALLDLGVDGIVTDRPDVLKTVLKERGQWRHGA